MTKAQIGTRPGPGPCNNAVSGSWLCFLRTDMTTEQLNATRLKCRVRGLVCPFPVRSHAKPWPKGWGFCSTDLWQPLDDLLSTHSGHVCFTPESGHVRRSRRCRLWAGHGYFFAFCRRYPYAREYGNESNDQIDSGRFTD